METTKFRIYLDGEVASEDEFAEIDAAVDAGYRPEQSYEEFEVPAPILEWVLPQMLRRQSQ